MENMKNVQDAVDKYKTGIVSKDELLAYLKTQGAIHLKEKEMYQVPGALIISLLNQIAELTNYKEGYNILAQYIDAMPDKGKQKLREQLEKLGL
jgi:hypothetical protein